MQIKPKIYVGCNLTHSPESFKQEVQLFKDYLKQNPTYKVLEFLGQSSKYTPEQVFAFDTNCVRNCDVFVANVTYPGLGVGAEFGIAVERKKPIITIAQKDAVVSRFVFGYTNPNHFIYRYKTIEDATGFVLRKLQELFQNATFAEK